LLLLFKYAFIVVW